MLALRFLIVAAGAVLCSVAIVVGRRRQRQARRRRLQATPIPDEWRAILERNVGLYRHLPPGLKEELHGHMQVILAEKRFEGCGGLDLTDEMRVTIAAQACLLLLNRRLAPPARERAADCGQRPGLPALHPHPQQRRQLGIADT